VKSRCAQVIAMIIQRQRTIGSVGIFILALAVEVFGAQTDWKKDWEQTVAAAKKEGQVTVYIYRMKACCRISNGSFPASTLYRWPGEVMS